MINNEPKYFTYFYSDFQEMVIKEVKSDPNLHLFLDGTFKWWPQIWNQLLNIWVFHREKQLYIPVAHVLMQSNKYEAYRIAISWFYNIFNVNPKFITIDFEPALLNAAKEIFPNSHIVPWFFHFVKCLWTNSGKWGLRKRQLVPLTKQLIFSIKGLAFRRPETVYKKFEQIKNAYIKKSTVFTQFLEYFESTWMDGIFQIKDWNYFDKLSEFEDLALTNNGLESFHQMIKSQLKRVNPSYTGFVNVLCKVETMKKADYENNKIKGDPQYNRCWPATTILKEIYFNSLKNEKSSPEDQVKEEIIDDSIESKVQNFHKGEEYFNHFWETKLLKDVISRYNESNGSTILNQQEIILKNNPILPSRIKKSGLIMSVRGDELMKPLGIPKEYMPPGLEEYIENDEEMQKLVKGDFNTKQLYFESNNK